MCSVEFVASKSSVRENENNAASSIQRVARVVRFMPHAAQDFEPALAFVECIAHDAPWECQYVALLWLSVLVLV